MLRFLVNIRLNVPLNWLITMTYETHLRPWCIVRQLPEMKQIIVDRFRRYQDADARTQFLRRQIPSSTFKILFAPEDTTNENTALDPTLVPAGMEEAIR